MVNPERIWSSQNLPTLPAVACRLLDLIQDPECTIFDVIKVVETDPALAVKLLKAANSSYHGIRNEVKTIERAVSLLGTTVSTSLSLGFVLSDDSMKAGLVADHYREFWKNSVVHAAAAECLAEGIPGQLAGEFFLMGLLLGIGQLAMLKTIPQEYTAVLEKSRDHCLPLTVAEREALGFDHFTIGSELMKHWKLPNAFVDAMTKVQQASAEQDAGIEPNSISLEHAAAMAACVGSYYCCRAKGEALERMRQLARSILEPRNISLDEFLSRCEQRIQSVGNLFDVDVSDLGSSSDLMMLAKEQLIQLTLQEHVSNTQLQLKQAALTAQKTQLEAQNRVLLTQVVHDPLTDLYNRKYFDESLTRELNRCQRQATPLAVIFADVDHFKSINDTYGHAVGDKVLCELAERFRSVVRASDVVARYGGEEIVILVRQPTERGLETFAERVRNYISATPFLLDGLEVNVTCSIGATIAIPGRRERNLGTRLIESADQAMYQAKKNGRNCVVVTSLISENDRRLQQQVTAGRFSRWLVQRNLLEIPVVSRALLECPPQTARIGELAIERGNLTSDQVDQILQNQEGSEQRFGELAISLGMLDQAQLIQLLILQHESPQRLASAIIRLGFLAPDVVASEVESYTAERFKTSEQASTGTRL